MKTDGDFDPAIEPGTTADLDEQAICNLLKPDKTIRDDVHGDIMITKLERSLIDTEDFQRLHGIRQLGPTYLVYPCAKHTRFEHSLGTLYMTNYLFEQVLKNPHKDPRVYLYVTAPDITIRFPPDTAAHASAHVTNYHLLLARLCALLHDLAHIPFGHTLEDEGTLFKGQWKDRERVNYFLGNDSKIGEAMKRSLIETLKISDSHAQQFSEKVLEDIRQTLTSDSEQEIQRLSSPYISDMINNTICADLLDYVKRDLFHCGLKESYDTRFLTFFFLSLYKEKPRMILRLSRPTSLTLRKDVIYSTIGLLRLRYSLAEKVYYHHAKISASAMIICAVNNAIENARIVVPKGGVGEDKTLYKIGEEQLLAMLRQDETAAYIIDRLKRRALYKPVYELDYTESKLYDPTYEKKAARIRVLKKPSERLLHERALETMSMLKRGQVIIYCPGPEMGQKAASTLVLGREKDPCPLDAIKDRDLQTEIKSSVIDKHESLWRMFVFVDPELGNDRKIRVAHCACALFDIKNEINRDEYCTESYDYTRGYKERAEQETGMVIGEKRHKEIVDAVKRILADRDPSIISYDEYNKEYCKVIKKPAGTE